MRVGLATFSNKICMLYLFRFDHSRWSGRGLTGGPSRGGNVRHCGGSVVEGCVLAVAALEHADQSAAATDVGDFHDLGGGPGEVLRQQVDAHPGTLPGDLPGVAHISRGGVEADGQQDERRVEGAQRGDQPLLDRLAVTLSA